MRKFFSLALIFALMAQIQPAAASDTFTYIAVGQSATAKSGLLVTMNNLELVQKPGSTQLAITYTQKNPTTDKKIDEGTFNLFFTDGTAETQYGSFNSLFPGDSKTRTYTWEWVNSKSPWLIEWEAGFFASKPTSSGLKWKVGPNYPEDAPTAPAGETLPASFTGGTISGSKVLPKSSQPYRISSLISIPVGSQLVVESGASLSVSSGISAFNVGGTLKFEGTSNNPIFVNLNGQFINALEGSTVHLKNTIVDGGRGVKIESKEFKLVESEFSNQTNCEENEILLNSDSVFEKNFFKKICGFSINVNNGVFGPRGNVPVTNNHFSGAAISGSWFKVSSLWKDGLNFTKNTFSGLSSKALARGFFATTVIAESNYWGTTDLSKVVSLSDYPVTQVLNAEDSATPSKSRVIATPTPTPTPTESTTPEASPSASVSVSSSGGYLVFKVVNSKGSAITAVAGG